MSKLRVGIVGCGKMGKVYAYWFNKNPHCMVNSFYNHTALKAKELSKLYPESHVYSRRENLIADKSIDIIGLCTPSHEHLSQFEMPVKKGKHVLYENRWQTILNNVRK